MPSDKGETLKATVSNNVKNFVAKYYPICKKYVVSAAKFCKEKIIALIEKIKSMNNSQNSQNTAFNNGQAPQYVAPNNMPNNGQAPQYVAPNNMSTNGQVPQYVAPNNIPNNGQAPQYVAPNNMSTNGQVPQYVAPNNIPNNGQAPQYGVPNYGQNPQYGAPNYMQTPQYGMQRHSVPQCTCCGHIGPMKTGPLIKPMDWVIFFALLLLCGCGFIYLGITIVCRMNKNNREKICTNCHAKNMFTYVY